MQRERQAREPLPLRFPRYFGREPLAFSWIEIPIGVAAALAAVAVRLALPLQPTQLPMLTVVIAVSLTATFIGLSAGIATAVVGGLLSWYLFFTPFSFSMGQEELIPLFGFAVIAAVILMGTHLYRTHAQRDYQTQLAAAQHQAQTSELFARELAHRLKNALAIVQSIAVQTLGDDTEQARAFAARLRALASAHDLLTEHVERPTAQAAEVVRSALRPFLDHEGRVRLQCPELAISAQTVISLALLLHELGTNASKYGALSSPRGWISLQLEDAGEAIRLSWHEHDGPEVRPDGRRGFGAKLLSRIGADPQFAFDPRGLRYTVSLRKT